MSLIIYDSIKPIYSFENHKFIDTQDHLLMKSIDSSFFPKDIHVVAIGDSLTLGYGDQSGNGGYVPVLEKMLQEQRGIAEVHIKNYGIGGIYSEQLIEELNNENVQHSIKQAEYVIITIGGNDVIKAAQENFLDLTTEAFLEENKEFTRKVNLMVNKVNDYNPDALIFFVGIYNPFSSLLSTSIPEVDKMIESWNIATEKELSKYENTYFIPLFDVFHGKEKEFLYEDMVHPNERGYSNIAYRVFTYIDRYDENANYVFQEDLTEEY